MPESAILLMDLQRDFLDHEAGRMPVDEQDAKAALRVANEVLSKRVLADALPLSATLIAVFVSVHIANHLAGLAGATTHIAFMEAARSVYRLGVIEWVLLSCVAFQVVSGLTLVVRGWKPRRGLVPWMQAVAGLYLAFFLIVHVGAVRFYHSVGHRIDVVNAHRPVAGWCIVPR